MREGVLRRDSAIIGATLSPLTRYKRRLLPGNANATNPVPWGCGFVQNLAGEYEGCCQGLVLSRTWQTHCLGSTSASSLPLLSPFPLCLLWPARLVTSHQQAGHGQPSVGRAGPTAALSQGCVSCTVQICGHAACTFSVEACCKPEGIVHTADTPLCVSLRTLTWRLYRGWRSDRQLKTSPAKISITASRRPAE